MRAVFHILGAGPEFQSTHDGFAPKPQERGLGVGAGAAHLIGGFGYLGLKGM